MPSWYDKAASDTLLAAKAALASPAFTGTPTIAGVPVAKTTDVTTAISNLVGGAASALDTLAEIDAQLAADEGSAAALAATVATKAPLASPAFTGTPTIAGSPVITAATIPPSSSNAPLAPQFHGARYTAYGHSFGQVQSTPNVWAGALYPARLRDLLHTDPALYVNRTVSGAEMGQIATAAAGNWTDGNGGLVTLMGNQNDVGHHTSQATFKAAVRSFLTTMLGSTGKPPTVLVIKDVTLTAAARAAFGNTTDADVATYNGYLDQVIAEFPAGWIITADPLAGGWDPTTMTAADGQHPNERGMACITAACLTTLAAAPYRPGLNVGVAGTAIFAAPTTPTALTITATGGDGQVTITASGGTGATSVALYRSSTVTGSPIATAFPFTDTGRSNGTTYSYVATATNAQGTVTSNVVTATPAGAGGGTGFTDNFNRADTSSGLGTASGGGTWPATTAFGISGNAAASVSAGSNQTVYATGGSASSQTVQATFAGTTSYDMSLLARASGSGATVSGWFAFPKGGAGNQWSLVKNNAGNYTLNNTSTTATTGDVVRIVATSTTVSLVVNGTTILTVTDSFNNTATGGGFWSGQAGSAWDDFSIA